MFSTRAGFACDSVIEFKVVLALAQLVRAFADENADLRVALKGGQQLRHCHFDYHENAQGWRHLG
jgi:hypothetical protein